MNALSPVSADLISRLRAACIKAEQEADKENRKLFVDWIGYRLLARAEKARGVIQGERISREVVEFLGCKESESNGGIARTAYAKIEFKRKPRNK